MKAAAALPQLWTAAEIAAKLGVTPRAIRLAMEGVADDGEKLVRGQRSKGWHVASLPDSLIERLHLVRASKGFRTISDLLSGQVERFVLTDAAGKPLSLAQIAPCEIARARMLQKALQRVLAHPEWRGSELESAGIEDYARVFGRPILESSWAKIHRRVVTRDGGLGEWHRLELYLPDNPKLAAPLPAATPPQLELLESCIGRIDRPAHASVAEKDLVWLRACDQLRALLDAGQDEKNAKRQIVAALLRFGGVGNQCAALKRNLNRKWAAYEAAEGKPSAVLDKRAEANQKRIARLPECDRERIIATIVDCEGRASEGWREVMEKGLLSQETTDRFISNPASKSYAPSTVLREVALDARKAVEGGRRPRKTEMNGAYIPGDPSAVYAGQVFTMDDCTQPVYYWIPDSSAPHGYRSLRGQFIPVVDERSWLVLTYTLHSDRNYNARLIRALLTHTHKDWGLPELLRVERGIWKTAKILTGDNLDLTHTEIGLREFVKFSHAKFSHGKAVAEKTMDLFQKKLARLPGYSSSNEITEPNEELARQLREIDSGAVHPSKYLLSRDELLAVFDDLIAEHNETVQQGVYLDNVSPLEFWNANQSEHGLLHLGSSASYLLANHRLLMKIGPKGLKLRKSLGGGLYADANTGRLAGRKMLVWVNPDDLSYIALTDVHRREKPIFVARVGPLPIHTAGRDAYKAEKAKVDAHNAYPLSVYRSIKPLLAVHKFRKLAVDRATVKMGEEMTAGMERAQVERKKKAAVTRKVSDLSRQLKVEPRFDHASTDSVARGLELLAEARQLAAAEKSNLP